MKTLGFDLSTQSVKLSVYCPQEKKCIFWHSEAISPPYYQTMSQTLQNPIVWIKTFFLALQKIPIELRKQIRAIGASAQQHGTVYWKKELNYDGMEDVNDLEWEGMFACDSPIWMDSSTGKECQELELIDDLLQITGSCCQERFSFPQMMKRRSLLNDCVHVSLCSSFLVAVLLGRFCAVDLGDASGMNLMDMKTRCYSKKILEVVTKIDVLQLLGGNPVDGLTVFGQIHPLFKSLGFKDCQIVAGTGDNNSSASLILCRNNDICISLGTSSTVFGYSKEYKPCKGGHVFMNAYSSERTNVDPYLPLLCVKNGDLVRKKLCQIYAEGSWKKFNELLQHTPPGNDSYVVFDYPEPEIIPKTNRGGVWKFDHQNKLIKKLPSPSHELRGVLESQFMQLKVNSQRLGLPLSNCRLIVTGGASQNRSILQILANVFQSDVFVSKATHDSASLGAAVRANFAISDQENRKHLDEKEISEVLEELNELEKVVAFDSTVAQVYMDFEKKYTVLEGKVKELSK